MHLPSKRFATILHFSHSFTALRREKGGMKTIQLCAGMRS